MDNSFFLKFYGDLLLFWPPNMIFDIYGQSQIKKTIRDSFFSFQELMDRYLIVKIFHLNQ